MLNLFLQISSSATLLAFSFLNNNYCAYSPLLHGVISLELSSCATEKPWPRSSYRTVLSIGATNTDWQGFFTQVCHFGKLLYPPLPLCVQLVWLCPHLLLTRTSSLGDCKSPLGLGFQSLCFVFWTEWRDPEFMREIEAATGLDLGSSKSNGKGQKKKGKKQKYPNLTDLKQQANTSRSRLEKKVFNK